MTSSGTLWICATPIGNRDDIGRRALRILRSVDLIACEDTRRTGRLLQQFDIEAELRSYHDHSEKARLEKLVARLRRGASMALVTDAGTPAVADPGYRLIARAHATGVPVKPVPGPSAVVAALSVAGLPTDAFRFIGFLPRKGRSRSRRLDEIELAAETVVFYETPHRLTAALSDLAARIPARTVAVLRELTKRHEECIRGPVREVKKHFDEAPPKGELTVVVAPEQLPAPGGGEQKSEKQAADGAGEADDHQRRVQNDLFRAQVDLLRRRGTSRMEAIKTVARGHQVPKNRVYQAVIQSD